MISYIKNWLYKEKNKEIKALKSKIFTLDEHMKSYINIHKDMYIKSSRHSSVLLKLKNEISDLEDVISGKDIQTSIASRDLAITQHAVDQFRSRFNNRGSDEQIRALIHKGLLKHLKTMDKLEDGLYDLTEKNQRARINRGAVVTVYYKKEKHG